MGVDAFVLAGRSGSLRAQPSEFIESRNELVAIVLFFFGFQHDQDNAHLRARCTSFRCGPTAVSLASVRVCRIKCVSITHVIQADLAREGFWSLVQAGCAQFLDLQATGRCGRVGGSLCKWQMTRLALKTKAEPHEAAAQVNSGCRLSRIVYLFLSLFLFLFLSILTES